MGDFGSQLEAERVYFVGKGDSGGDRPRDGEGTDGGLSDRADLDDHEVRAPTPSHEDAYMAGRETGPLYVNPAHRTHDPERDLGASRPLHGGSGSGHASRPHGSSLLVFGRGNELRVNLTIFEEGDSDDLPRLTPLVFIRPFPARTVLNAYHCDTEGALL